MHSCAEQYLQVSLSSAPPPRGIRRGRRDQGVVARGSLRAAARRQHRRRRRQLNKMLAAAGSDKRVKIELNETNAKGYDDDALDLLKAFAVDKGPDIFVLAHEWTGAFARSRLRAESRRSHRQEPGALRRHHRAPLAVGELQGRAVRRAAGLRGPHVFPQQRQAAQDGQDRQGDRRPAGEGRRGRVHGLRPVRPRRPGGAERASSKYGILHRPNAGPDFQMMMEGFGIVPYDKAEAKLQASKAAAQGFLHLGQVLRRQEGDFRDQHLDVVGRDRAGFVRQGRGAGLLPWRLARHRPEKAWNLKGKDDYQQEDHLDQLAGRQEGRQADQPVAPDRVRRVGQVEEQGPGRLPRRARQPADAQHAPCGDDEPHADPLRPGSRCRRSSKKAGRWSRRRRC